MKQYKLLFILIIWFATTGLKQAKAASPPPTGTEQARNEKRVVTLYFRWNTDKLDKAYLTNAQTLSCIDSLLRIKSADTIDSLHIVAYASPEGSPAYNKRLSVRRANTLKNYLLSAYPHLREEQILTDAKGENWEGLRRMAAADPQLPMKEQVVSILNNPNITDLQRQAQMAKLNGGKLYKEYILPNYYRYLRTGASLFFIYSPESPAEPDVKPAEVVVAEAEPQYTPPIEPQAEETPILKYPIALRTNLLYDAIGGLNIGAELPYGSRRNWSILADIAYAYWRSSRNRQAFQTLEYGIENRYWLGVGKERKARLANWAQPLKGAYVGVYGKYWQRYDVQFVDGYQGDASWSGGITAGYVLPVSRHLSFDLGIGGGWLSTSEYRHYHKPEYDENGKYHLMWQETGRWSGLMLTKVRFSLVWLFQIQKKGGDK